VQLAGRPVIPFCLGVVVDKKLTFYNETVTDVVILEIRSPQRMAHLLDDPLHDISTQFHPIIAYEFQRARIAGFEFSMYFQTVVTSHHTLIDCQAKLVKDGPSHNCSMTRSKGLMI
jgi:hypothetical protein